MKVEILFKYVTSYTYQIKSITFLYSHFEKYFLFLSNVGTHVTCKASGHDKNFDSGKNIQECIFPFIQNGLKYEGCAESTEKGKGPLCATEVDAGKQLKKWARCNKYCETDSGKIHT